MRPPPSMQRPRRGRRAAQLNGIGRADGPNRSRAGPDRFAADEGAASAAVPCRRRAAGAPLQAPARRTTGTGGARRPAAAAGAAAAPATAAAARPARSHDSGEGTLPVSVAEASGAQRRHATRAFASQAPAAQACHPQPPIPRGAVRPAFPAAAGAPLGPECDGDCRIRASTPQVGGVRGRTRSPPRRGGRRHGRSAALPPRARARPAPAPAPRPPRRRPAAVETTKRRRGRAAQVRSPPSMNRGPSP